MEKEDKQFLDKSKQEQEFLDKSKVPKKEVFRLQIPYNLRYALAWTCFFIVIGIVIQSIQSGTFVFSKFFASNYAGWFRSFGNFVSMRVYSSPSELIYAILGQWYYFFYTGGLISVLWALIMSLVNSEISFTKKPKQE